MRECLCGNCTGLGLYTESRKCVFLPCVAGTYSANSITPIAMLDVQNSRYVKFFKIGLINFFGDTTRRELYIYQVDVLTNSVRRSQIVPAENSIPFDLMKRYPRIYLVVQIVCLEVQIKGCIITIHTNIGFR